MFSDFVHFGNCYEKKTDLLFQMGQWRFSLQGRDIDEKGWSVWRFAFLGLRCMLKNVSVIEITEWIKESDVLMCNEMSVALWRVTHKSGRIRSSVFSRWKREMLKGHKDSLWWFRWCWRLEIWYPVSVERLYVLGLYVLKSCPAWKGKALKLMWNYVSKNRKRQAMISAGLLWRFTSKGNAKPWILFFGLAI